MPMFFALRPSDVKWVYTEALPMATAAAYGSAATAYAISGGQYTAGFTRANKMASFIARSHWNAAAGIARTPLIRGGTATIGSAVGGFIGGYLLGAAVGTGIAYAWKGEKGARDAIDLYTFQVSPGEYASAVRKKFASLF